MYMYLYTDVFEKAYPIDFSLKYKDERIEQAYFDFLCVLENLDIINTKNKQYPKLISKVV